MGRICGQLLEIEVVGARKIKERQGFGRRDRPPSRTDKRRTGSQS
nr:hypothetical protein [Hydrococcus rivularis]